jgi:hypothetical protein
VRVVVTDGTDHVLVWAPDVPEHQGRQEHDGGVPREHGTQERLDGQSPVIRAEVVGHPGSPEQRINNHPG